MKGIHVIVTGDVSESDVDTCTQSVHRIISQTIAEFAKLRAFSVEKVTIEIGEGMEDNAMVKEISEIVRALLR